MEGKTIRADFHIHTDRSDGLAPPKEVVRLAHAGGLDTIAITDHDSLGALEEAAHVAHELGIRLIPGTELTATIRNHEIHLLAYFGGMNPEDPHGSPGLRRFVADVQAARRERLRAAVMALRVRGIFIRESDVFVDQACESYTRLHLARALVRTGYASGENEAFKKLLRGDKGAVPNLEITPETVINLVHQHGGLVVWAHPEGEEFEKHIDALVAAGIDGIETHNFRRRDKVGALTEKARARNLLITGGSDWHGSAKERALGTDHLDETLAAPFLTALSRKADA